MNLLFELPPKSLYELQKEIFVLKDLTETSICVIIDDIFDYLQDEAILGGTKIEVAGLTFDDSLQSHLNRMSENLNRSSL